MPFLSFVCDHVNCFFTMPGTPARIIFSIDWFQMNTNIVSMGSEVEFVHGWGIHVHVCRSTFYESSWSILAILIVFIRALCLDVCHSLWWTSSVDTATTSSKTRVFIFSNFADVRYSVFEIRLRVRYAWAYMTDWEIFTFLDRYLSIIINLVS
jgi:hypothetical protein